MDGRSESQLAKLAETAASTQLGAQLGEWTVQELIDADEAVRALEEHPGFKVIARLIGETEDFALTTLIHAPRAVDSAAALQKQLGVVKGLSLFHAVIPTIREKAEAARARREAAAEAADAEREAAAT